MRAVGCCVGGERWVKKVFTDFLQFFYSGF